MELFERYEVMIQADVNGLSDSIGNWLEAMADGLSPGRFRFCAKGSFVPVDGNAAQVSLFCDEECLASRAVGVLG